jgi:hypothetical protein
VTSVASKSDAKWHENWRAMQQPKAWDESDQPAEPRTCTYCQRTMPNTSGYWPGWMTIHPGFRDEIPCNDCYPTVMAKYAPTVR